MSSAAKLAVNAANAQASTGPRTEEGKAVCSKNAITLGLYARRDFIRPEEEPIYARLEAELQAELAPNGVLEQNLVDEIRRCTWRLRRCGQVEANLILRLNGDDCILDAMETTDARAEKIQKSVDRARSQAHRLLHKCTAELRKLQTDRQFAAEAFPEGTDHTGFGLIDWRTVIKNVPITKQTQAEPPSAQKPGRNAVCPCKSGLKYKRCCGKDAPAVLHAA